jgi:ACS family tartrate transporter-like MFS transporter
MTKTPTPTEVSASVAAKFQRHVLPLLIAAWFIAYLDRFNVSFAGLQMNKELGLSSTVFGLGAGLFFLGYALFEIPSNIILLRVGARRWLGRIMVSWGVISAAMMFTQGPRSFYALRLLLGVAEAGAFPGMAFYLSQWLAPRERAAALGALGSCAMISGIVGGPLAAGLLALHGVWGISGWQWLFLVEAVPAIAIGIWVVKALPERPEGVAWLTPTEQALVRSRMAVESVIERVPTLRSVWEVARDPQYLTWGVAFMGASATGSALRLFRPSILREVAGLSDVVASVLTAVPAIVGAIAMIYIGRHSTRTDERRWHTVVPMFVGAVSVVLVGVTYGLFGALVVSSLASIGGAAQPPLFASVTSAARGSTNAIGIAFVNSLGGLGGFVGPYLVGYVMDSSGLASACLLAGAFMGTGGLLVLAGRQRVAKAVTSTVALS